MKSKSDCTRRTVYAESVRGVLLANKVNKSFLKKILKQEKSLQARGNYSKVSHYFFWLHSWLTRASLTLPACIKGVITIEASIAIPVFLFCFLEIMSLFHYISTYSGILYVMKQVGDPVCIHGYAYNMIMEGTGEQKIGEQIVSSLIFSEGYLDTQIRKYCSDTVNENYIQNGIKGISLLGSNINRDSGVVSIVARYALKPMFSIAGTEYKVISRYYGRLWTGYTLKESEIVKEYVYVTETGSVYHLSKDCTYLRLSVSSVGKTELDEKRNESGARYKPCEICFDSKRPQELYYITKSGNRYHSEIGCSSLKRTIYRIELAEIEQRSVCSRCSQGE